MVSLCPKLINGSFVHMHPIGFEVSGESVVFRKGSFQFPSEVCIVYYYMHECESTLCVTINKNVVNDMPISFTIGSQSVSLCGS